MGCETTAGRRGGGTGGLNVTEVLPLVDVVVSKFSTVTLPRDLAIKHLHKLVRESPVTYPQTTVSAAAISIISQVIRCSPVVHHGLLTVLRY